MSAWCRQHARSFGVGASVVGVSTFGGLLWLRQREERMAAALRARQKQIFIRRTAVVVGATSGIGEGCALRLAEAGYTVVAVGRDPERGNAIKRACAQRSANLVFEAECKPSSASGKIEHSFIPCNVFSLKDVQRCSAEIQKLHPRIDALVLSPGMATIQGFTPTVDGNDQKLTLHYWGRMAFVTQLLPGVRHAEDPRVISVLSGGVHSPFEKFREDPELRHNYSVKNAADIAGFYTDLGLDALAHEKANEGVVFVHTTPGVVNTNWGTEMPWYIRSVVRALFPIFGKKAETCAEFMLAPVFRSREELLSGAGFELNGSDVVTAPAEPSVAASRNRIVILNQYAEPASITKLHTPGNKDFVWQKTEEVLVRAGLSIPSGEAE